MEKLLCIRFCNEITIGIENGFENNVKCLKEVLCKISEKFIIILPNKDVKSQITVPMSNIASYFEI